MCDGKWKTSHGILSPILCLLLSFCLIYWQPLSMHCSKTLFHQHSGQTIMKVSHSAWFLLGSNKDQTGGIKVSYWYAIQLVIIFPLITPFPINPLVQSCRHSPKNYDIYFPIKLGNKPLPLSFLILNHSNSKTPYTTKNN